MLCFCSEPPAHTSGATFSELCQIGASLQSAGWVPIFLKWVRLGQAHEGLTWDQWGSGRCLGVSEHPWAPALTSLWLDQPKRAAKSQAAWALLLLEDMLSKAHLLPFSQCNALNLLQLNTKLVTFFFPLLISLLSWSGN